MKKIIITLMAIASLTFISCANDDGTKADLRWSNEANEIAKDIKWMNGSTIDQRWDGEYNDGDKTPYKGINALTGQGECVDNSGNTAAIDIDTNTSEGIEPSSSTSTAVIKENAAATLVINNIAKKK